MAMTRARLPVDFLDRLRDLLATVQAEQSLLRPALDDDRLDRIVRLAMKQTGAALGLLLLANEDRGDLRVAAALGPPSVVALRGSHVARTGVAGFALDDGNPLAIADVSSAAHGAADEIEQRTGLVTRNVLAVPLAIHGRTSGVLELRNVPDARGFTPDHVELATELALLAAAAVEEFRGDRFLLSLFQGALPRALAADRGSESDGLRDELARWLAELRQTPAWREELALVSLIRELCASGEGAVATARQILEAVVDRERARARERLP